LIFVIGLEGPAFGKQADSGVWRLGRFTCYPHMSLGPVQVGLFISGKGR
jgi:hypothetical protein